MAAQAHSAAMCAKDYPALKDGEMVIIDEGEVLEASVDDPSQLKPELRAIVDKSEALLASHARIADAKDVAIIDGARALLRDESVWNRADNRECHTGDARVSLFCALQFASREVTGEYRHRRTALEEVRMALEDATRDRRYAHRLMDFNNDPRTRLGDVYAVLATARGRLIERLKLQEACKL
jgi:ElaB/YqjD/DUF883 family membrane-anchored ribosome-binding protein